MASTKKNVDNQALSNINYHNVCQTIIIICYFILCLSYAIRGNLNIFGTRIEISHHFMQFIVSTTYFTIAYSYLIKTEYEESIETDQSLFTHLNFFKIIIIYLIIVFLLLLFYIIFKRENAVVS